MDNKTFCQTLSNRTDIDPKITATAIETLGNILGETCRDGNTVIIPAFGTFTAELHPEEVRVDHSSGKRILCPPELTLKFEPSNTLIKSLNR